MCLTIVRNSRDQDKQVFLHCHLLSEVIITSTTALVHSIILHSWSPADYYSIGDARPRVRSQKLRLLVHKETRTHSHLSKNGIKHDVAISAGHLKLFSRHHRSPATLNVNNNSGSANLTKISTTMLKVHNLVLRGRLLVSNYRACRYLFHSDKVSFDIMTVL